jgi:hypothetical protein
MNFFYSSGAMGYGKGYSRHEKYNFPEFPLVTKTLTRKSREGNPWAVLPVGSSVYNRVGLDNIGLYNWIGRIYHDLNYFDVTVSIAGYDNEILRMVESIDCIPMGGIELNFSCPNVKNLNNVIVPSTRHKLYLKLNHKQDPYKYNLDGVDGIRVNSIPMGFCGGSGKIAQKKNWKFIKKFNREGLNVAGCSWTSVDDLKRLEDMGCEEIGIGSVILTKPRLVEALPRII